MKSFNNCVIASDDIYIYIAQSNGIRVIKQSDGSEQGTLMPEETFVSLCTNLAGIVLYACTRTSIFKIVDIADETHAMVVNGFEDLQGITAGVDDTHLIIFSENSSGILDTETGEITYINQTL